MKFRKKQNQTQNGRLVKNICLGTAIACLATGLFTALITLGITKGMIRMELAEIGAYLIVALASLLGCGICAFSCKSGKLVASAICGTAYYLILLTVGIILDGGGKDRLLPTAAIVSAAALICGFISSNERKAKF